MTTHKCPACGSNQLATAFNAEPQPLARYGLRKDLSQARSAQRYPLTVVRCVGCGLLFNKEFDFSSIDYGSEGVQESRVFSPRIRDHMLESARSLKSRLDLKGKVVVEIGCGEGFFLEQFSGESACIGFEPSPEGYEAEKRGLQVHHRYFDPKGEQHLGATLVIMRQVLEHLPDPAVYLRAIRKLLTQSGGEGCLYVEVPNSNKTIEECRFHDFYYEHFAYYTSASLVNLLERCGFRVLSVRETFDGEILEAVSSALSHETVNLLPALEERREHYVSLVDRYLREGKKVVAWGTAGNGCSFLNLCGLTTDKISLVVDSDVRKQGLYLPGTGQLVVSPESLHETRPDVVIILSQFHKADITRQIRAMLSPAPLIITVGDRG